MELPNEIMNKIMLYNSHPLADLFKDKFKLRLEIFRSANSLDQLFGIWALMEEMEFEWGAEARAEREAILRNELR